MLGMGTIKETWLRGREDACVIYILTALAVAFNYRRKYLSTAGLRGAQQPLTRQIRAGARAQLRVDESSRSSGDSSDGAHVMRFRGEGVATTSGTPRGIYNRVHSIF
jgi:hypothetical protein